MISIMSLLLYWLPNYWRDLEPPSPLRQRPPCDLNMYISSLSCSNQMLFLDSTPSQYSFFTKSSQARVIFKDSPVCNMLQLSCNPSHGFYNNPTSPFDIGYAWKKTMTLRVCVHVVAKGPPALQKHVRYVFLWLLIERKILFCWQAKPSSSHNVLLSRIEDFYTHVPYTLEQRSDWIQLECTRNPRAPWERPNQELWNEPHLDMAVSIEIPSGPASGSDLDWGWP